MTFTASNAFANLAVTSVNDTTSKVEFQLPLANTSYQADSRVLFLALFDSLNNTINGLNPKPASVLVNKATNMTYQGGTPITRDVYTVTIVRQAIPGNFVVDP